MQWCISPHKLVPPRLGGGAIARDALLARLHHGRDAGLVLLTASPGYGKTTLLVQWRRDLQGAGARVSWLTLEPVDDDPARLCSAIGAASGLGTQPDSVDALLAALADLPGEHYLMLDAGESLRDPAAWAVLQALVDASLPRLRVVLAMRHRPALRLARLAAQGALCHIGDIGDSGDSGDDALAFSLAETVACVAGARGPAEAARVHAETRGWPTGVRLLGASGQHGQPAALAAYWTEVVAPMMSAAQWHFLRHLAWLERCSPALAAAVTGCTEADAARMLEALAAQGLFVSADGSPARWYRVHPLLAAWLRGTAPLDAQALDALHRAAALGWLAGGSPAEALAHALRANDASLVTRVVCEAMPAVPAVSQLRALPAWLDGVDPSYIGQQAAMHLAAAWACTVTARIDEAHAWLARIDHDDGDQNVAQQVALLRASMAFQRDDPDDMRAWLARLGGGPLAHPSLDILRAGLRVRCDAMFHRAMRPLPVLADAPAELALMAHGGASLALLIEGDARGALAIGLPAARIAQSVHGSRSVSACMCAVPVGAALLELGQIDAAMEMLASRADLARYSSPDVLIVATLCQARLQWLAGDQQGARTTLSDAQTHAAARGLARVRARCLAQRVLFALQSADPRHAAQLQAELDTLAGQAGDTPRARDVATIAALSRARVALAGHGAADAALLLASIHTDNAGLGVVIDMLLARAHAALAQPDASQRHLDSALAGGLRLGLLRTLRDEPGMAALFEGAPLSGDAVRDAWLAQVRAPATPWPGAAACLPVAPQRGASSGTDRLTPRERDIVALLDQSMSNKHIAQALQLSVDTVKWNLRQIYAKLDVSTRYDAILALRNRTLRTGTA